MTTKRWEITNPDETKVQAVQQALAISQIAAKILVARGLDTPELAKAFLHIDENALHDPFLMYGMEAAVERIHRAVAEKEKIVVYGDYDADGITSSTVLKSALIDLGADVHHVIPNRFIDGYGPSERLFKEFAEEGYHLIITVDNGIAGNGPIDVAKALGVDVIVTDHHEAGAELPNADIIIHPRHPEGNYPFGELAGVGVAFKLAQALLGKFPEHLLEFVAIGTIADLVPLVDENRYLVKAGLKRLTTTTNIALQALAKIAGTELSDITEETVGFSFGPRLNALGRLGDAAPAVDFMLNDHIEEAAAMATMLNDKNKERQKIVADLTQQAIDMVENIAEIRDAQVLVVAEEGWNAGVVGIVASRLVEKYYKPTIVLGIDIEKGIAKGSARSIEGFNMYKELDTCRDVMIAFGGHPMAAGMTLEMENVDELRNRLHAQSLLSLSPEDLIPVVKIDLPITVDEINVDAIDDIRKLAPFGSQFAKPQYGILNTQIKSMRKIGANEDHVKMELSNGGNTLDAIGFHKGFMADELTQGIDVSFTGDLQINEWNGNRKPQLLINDVKTEQWQLFDIRGGNKISKWLQKIPMDSTTFVAFKKETVDYFSSLIPKEIQLYDEKASKDDYFSFVVLLDLPQSAEQLQTMLALVEPSRIYAHFFVANSHLFDGLPTREQFIWYYSFLKQRKEFHLRHHLNDLAKHKGWSRAMLIFMTQVFFELKFVTIENGLAKIVENPQKREITSAEIYIERTEQVALEQKLLYAKYTDLRRWFEECLQPQTVSEEEL
ncbi:single-stranded-DNA-specific exonuclease RecJ [Kurthia sibirica]|uniref:Single-stranded-DNA-specific exonuclease RecJ n=1 Tax=Kurthia sibirica TaxID=202750 RepID=A0A2U3AII4_9BACL|nr:single-stranded-DNA-specific exonuclease RecJ [Kurthia sibirica]PWI24345.1 single-stranded-DNA-specific exonuclease RecJ [Kurthia sibirica]GEK34368.1 single-stranded-DNA-specific exonuclease RecJ [Kurthia sibirica]